MRLIKVKFKQDFATVKKGDIISLDSGIASGLIKRGIAEESTRKASSEKKPETKPEAKKKTRKKK